MFHQPRPNLFESDDFSVEVLGRNGILYKEGERTMLIGSEVLATGSPAGIAVWRKSIHNWRPPHEAEQIDEAKRVTIIENIRGAIRFGGEDIEVIG